MTSSNTTSLKPFHSTFPKMIWYAVLGLTLLILELSFQSHHLTFLLKVKQPRIPCPYHRFIFHKGSKLKKTEIQITWSAMLAISSLSFRLKETPKATNFGFFSILFKLMLNLIGKLHHLCWNQSVGIVPTNFKHILKYCTHATLMFETKMLQTETIYLLKGILSCSIFSQIQGKETL